MKNSIFFLLFISCISSSTANERDSLVKLSEKIIFSETDNEKESANVKFKQLLLQEIEAAGSFQEDFSFIDKLSIVQAENIKIYNWTLPLIDGTYKYFGFIQVKTGKDKFKIVDLTDKSSTISSPEKKVLRSDNWYGALYYQIIHIKKLGKNYYTLLGWDGNNTLSSKKIIETMSVTKSGNIKFGLNLLKINKTNYKRVIFEYSSQAIMSLKFDPGSNQVVFDYLVPTSSSLSGIFEYYGPSLNRFDSFKQIKNKWIYQKDIDIMLPKSKNDQFFQDPLKN